MIKFTLFILQLKFQQKYITIREKPVLKDLFPPELLEPLTWSDMSFRFGSDWIAFWIMVSSSKTKLDFKYEVSCWQASSLYDFLSIELVDVKICREWPSKYFPSMGTWQASHHHLGKWWLSRIIPTLTWPLLQYADFIFVTAFWSTICENDGEWICPSLGVLKKSCFFYCIFF